MALDKGKSSEKAAANAADQAAANPAAPMSRKRRWLVFGANVVVALLLATALMIAAVYLSDKALRGRARADMTASGRFSLSPRTKAILSDLPCKVTITNLYEHTPEAPDTEMRFERVRDLLKEYATAAPDKVTLETVDRETDPVAIKALLDRLKEPYAKDIKAGQQVADKFLGLDEELLTLLDAEGTKFYNAAKALKLALAVEKSKQDEAAVAPKDSSPEADAEYYKAADEFLAIANSWRMVMRSGAEIAEDLQVRTTRQALPEYIAPLTSARKYFKSIGLVFDSLDAVFLRAQGEMPKGVPMPDAIKKLMAEAKATYEPIRKKMADFEKEASVIKETELDRIAHDLQQGDALLVETPTRAKVVAFDDVWIPTPDAGQEPEDEESIPRLFAGESALTSVLMGLCNQEHPAILFVGAGNPATIYGGAYSRLADRLRKMNFLVDDWDVARQPEMPKHENVSMTILVFVPPAPQNPRMPMPMPPPSPEQYRAAIAAVRAGTPAVLLGQPMSPRGQAVVPYADLFPLFGVDPKWNATAVFSVLADQATGREVSNMQVKITAYAQHPITQTMGALPSMFFDCAPLMIKDDPASGVTAQPLVLLPDRPDYWADVNRQQVEAGTAKRDPSEALIGSLPLAVAATRKTPAGDQKAVLFGTSAIAQDFVAFYSEQRGKLTFPGNSELFINSLLWMSGDEHLISISPEALQARRLGDPGKWMLPLQIGIIGGLPVIVLVVGIVVYLLRRG